MCFLLIPFYLFIYILLLLFLFFFCFVIIIIIILLHFVTTQYPMFNAGPRLCLGQRVAIVEASVVVALILLHFKLKLAPATSDKYGITIVLPMKDGLLVSVEQRDM